MKKRLINISILYLIILFVLAIVGCSNTEKEVLTDKAFDQIIDEKLNNIVNLMKKNISQSSNLNDYIMGLEHNRDYTYIISQREKSLKYMLEKFSYSNTDELEEYIMATACSKMLKQNPYTQRWDTGRQWYDDYIEFINNNPYITGNHDTNIEPKYKSNKDKPLSSFLSKERILECVDKYQTKTKKSKIKSIEIKTYKEHMIEDIPNKFSYDFMVDPDRMVWIVITEFPEGIATKKGLVENGTLIAVFDGESGDLLLTSVIPDGRRHDF